MSVGRSKEVQEHWDNLMEAGKQIAPAFKEIVHVVVSYNKGEISEPQLNQEIIRIAETLEFPPQELYDLIKAHDLIWQ